MYCPDVLLAMGIFLYFKIDPSRHTHNTFPAILIHIIS